LKEYEEVQNVKTARDKERRSNDRGLLRIDASHRTGRLQSPEAAALLATPDRLGHRAASKQHRTRDGDVRSSGQVSGRVGSTASLEDDGIKAEREKCEKLLSTYKEAAKIVGEVL